MFNCEPIFYIPHSNFRLFIFFTMKLTQKIVDQWIAECQAVAQRVLEEGGQLPDFATLDPRGDSKNSSKSEDWSELSKRPYDSCKCRARTWKDGYSIQCSRSHMEGSTFCKTHHNKHEDFAEKGFALRFGYYDEERPAHWMDRADGEDCLWADTRKSKKNTAKKSKMKKGELMDYLSTRVPNESLKGLKKGELQDLYDKQIEQENSSSDTETEPMSDTEEQAASIPVVELEPEPESAPEPAPPRESSPEPAPAPESSPAPAPEPAPEPAAAPAPEPAPEYKSDLILEPITSNTDLDIDTSNDGPVVDGGVEIVKNSNGTETEIHLHKHIMEGGVYVEPEDRAGDGPNTVPEFKKMYKELGISEEKYKSLRGLRAHQKFWEEQQVSPAEDDSDSDSDEDERNLCEIDYDGVEYLEDTDSGEIFNSKKQKIGEWDENGDVVIWENDTFRIAHEAQID